MAQHPDNIQGHDNDELMGSEKIWDAYLLAALYRQDCPDTMTLSQYQLGLLTASEAAQLTVHLDRCPDCQVELNRLIEFLAQESPVAVSVSAEEAANWAQANGFEWRHLKKTGQVFIRLMAERLDAALTNLQQGLQPPGSQVALGGLRGKSDQRLLELALREGPEDFEAVITVDTNWRDPRHCTVMVEVNIPSRGGWPYLHGTEVALKQAEVDIARQTTNAFGRTVFEGIAIADLMKFSFEITPRSSE
jgi:hypothetical protein